MKKKQRIVFKIDNPNHTLDEKNPEEPHMSVTGWLEYWGNKSEYSVINNQGMLFHYTMGICVAEDTGEVHEVLPSNITFIKL